jgi:hypothetical protein
MPLAIQIFTHVSSCDIYLACQNLKPERDFSCRRFLNKCPMPIKPSNPINSNDRLIQNPSAMPKPYGSLTVLRGAVIASSRKFSGLIGCKNNAKHISCNPIQKQRAYLLRLVLECAMPSSLKYDNREFRRHIEKIIAPHDKLMTMLKVLRVVGRKRKRIPPAIPVK